MDVPKSEPIMAPRSIEAVKIPCCTDDELSAEFSFFIETKAGAMIPTIQRSNRVEREEGARHERESERDAHQHYSQTPSLR